MPFEEKSKIKKDNKGTGIWNTLFDNCTFVNIDFENAYFEKIVFRNSKFINPINLDKATKIVINIGSVENPQLLTHEESLRWITDNSIS